MKKIYNLIFFLCLAIPSFAQSDTDLIRCLGELEIKCPRDAYGVCADNSLSPNELGNPEIINEDTSCPDPQISYKDFIISDNSCQSKLIARRWIATYDGLADEYNQFETCLQVIGITYDANAPVISNCPANIQAETNCNTISWTPPTLETTCGIQSFASNYSPNSAFDVGTTQVTYTATDKCGRTSQCNFRVMVAAACCNTAPSITCPDDVTICTEADRSPNSLGFPMTTSSSSFCPSIDVSYDDVFSNGDEGCQQNGEVIRTWTAAYDNGLKSSCAQTITVEDNDTPTLVSCPTNILIQDNGNIATWELPTFNDQCGIKNITSNYDSGDSFPEGTTQVTYVATDICDRQITCAFNVTIENTCQGPPVITCPERYVGCPGDSAIPSNTGYATAQAGDHCGEIEIEFNDNILSAGPCHGAISVNRTWRATDKESGVYSTCLQRIRIRDNNNPVIRNCPSNITINDNEAASWTLPTATDNCSLRSLTSTHQSGSAFPVGETTVTYTARDICENSATCSFSVFVSETCQQAPSITCPSNISVCPGISDPSATGTATATRASDVCDVPTVTFSDSNQNNTTCNNTITRTWTAEANGRTSSCAQTITQQDVNAPIISNCPSDITRTDQNANVSWNVPTVTDNCGVQFFDSNIAPGSAFNLGTTTVTYTGRDRCGNEATCSFNVTITPSCTNDFDIACPFMFVACLGTDTDPSNTTYPVITNGGTPCENPSVTYNDVLVTDQPCEKLWNRTWTATAGNVSKSCTQMIRLRDDDNPVLSNCPSNIVLSNGNNRATWNAPTATDGCGLKSISSNYNSGDTFPEGSTTVVYTATDNCDKTVQCSFVVTVEAACNARPQITCPTNTVVCPSASIDPQMTGQATVLPGGTGCSQPTLEYSDNTTSDELCNKIVKRTWTAKADGRSRSCTQTIRLRDTQRPSIANCPSNIRLTADNPIANWTAPIANDDCGISSFSSNYSSGDSFSEGTTTVVYTATDNCNKTRQCSFNVIVASACNVRPEITCPDNVVICPGSSINPQATGQAVGRPGSNACSQPTIQYSDETTKNEQCDRIIKRTWKADADGRSRTCNQTIRLRDNQKPTITNCPGDIRINSDNPIATWNAPSANDNCGISSFSSNYRSGDSFPVGTTKVTYTATDNCGNSRTCTFNVNVAQVQTCVDKPQITCPSTYRACIGASTNPQYTGSAHASSVNGCSAASVTYDDTVITNQSCKKTIRRVWTARFTENNKSSSCSQTIELKDDQAPIIQNCPSNIVVSSSQSYISWNVPTASDNCGSPTLTSNKKPGDSFPIGISTVTYVATDACGNTSTCSFTVERVQSNSGGSVFDYCPDDIHADCSSSNTVTWNLPRISSTCSSCEANEIQGFVYMGSLNGSKYYCSKDKALWKNAQAFSKASGGNLATISSAEENEFLAAFLDNQSAYIGLSDHQSEGNFVWADGAPLTYTNWYKAQPNNYQNSQDFVELLPTGEWNDQYNNVALEYIMEIPCVSLEQTAGPSPGSQFQNGSTRIEYTLTDACGTVKKCSFNVIVSGGITLECPSDITVQADSYNGKVVNWDNPSAQTCCNNCSANGGQEISGFVYMGSYGGSHYYCSKQNRDWNYAKQHCENNGGRLAIIESSGENNFLASQLEIQRAFIGLSDHQSEGTMRWVNGSILGSYAPWYPGQPNDYAGQQDFVALLNNGQWNDENNTDKLEYIMEIPGCLNVEQIEGPANGSKLAVGSHWIKYRATDGCGNSEVCQFKVTVKSAGNQGGGDYCAAGAPANSRTYIDQISFGHLYADSGDNGGYIDLTDQCISNFKRGASYTLSLVPGFYNYVSTVHWAVYADYNQDGDFHDSGEFVARGSSHKSVRGTVQIPYSAKSGKIRLRVMMQKGAAPDGPCDQLSDGEVEDYCIVINNSNLREDVLKSRANDDVTIQLENAPEIETEETLQTEEYTMTISPNPAVHTAMITSVNTNRFEIADLSGRLMKQIQVSADDLEHDIDISSLANGVYIIRAFHNDGNVTSEKLIKVK